MKEQYQIPTLPLPYELETNAVLRQLALANRKLAELKGVAKTIPNESILISTLGLQEARESSAVENIVTTQDELYRADLNLRTAIKNASAKEVVDYREALREGFEAVRGGHPLTLGIIRKIQAKLEHNNAGFRRLPGTQLKRQDGSVVYTPPQDGAYIDKCMDNLEKFINDDTLSPLDPLVKMAIIHHQFESIHPFSDANGRTGRIICVLYLVLSGLLDLPILYLSRYIIQNKGEYYRLLQTVRDKSQGNAAEWEEWIVFMLKGVEETSSETIKLVLEIGELMGRYKTVLRGNFGKAYRHELINNLFSHPYTRLEYVQRDMQVTRPTAAKYLERIVRLGLLDKFTMGSRNYYVNTPLVNLFLNVSGKNNG